MNEEPPLTPLSDAVKQALDVERSRPDLPAVSQSSLKVRIEATNDFVVATGARVVSASGTLRPVTTQAFTAIKTRAGMLIFTAGAFWGLIIGASSVAMMRAPVPLTQPVAPAERAALESARVSLTQGRPADALVTLDAHAREYPSSALAEERESLAIRALVANHQRDAAIARAAAFRQQYPKSMLLPAVDAHLAAPP